MKRLIKWLADVSGVTREIQIKQNKYVGCQMRSYAYWFTAHPKIFRALWTYGEDVLMEGHEHPFGDLANRVRDKILKQEQ